VSAVIKAIAYHLPERVLTNEELARDYPEWTADRIEAKLGIVSRHIAAAGECASDLGVKAAEKLFASGVIQPTELDFLLFCTQAPDYFLPSSACLMQDRLGLPTTAGALDFNLGCSGFIYGLSLAKGLIETGQARNLLLVTADTYSKYIHIQDKSVRTLFGDGAAATLIQEIACDAAAGSIGPFSLGTDGRGGRNLMVEVGAFRKPNPTKPPVVDEHGTPLSEACLYMNGGEILNFTLMVVPEVIDQVLTKAGLTANGIDLWVFHQANTYILEILRRKCGIPKEKFFVSMREVGNTVSSTIPIALKHAELAGSLRPGMTVMLVGFGVGYSWGAAVIRWSV
jgi:3-oxoacyl-[acyl-carrier-protein] synthase-3